MNHLSISLHVARDMTALTDWARGCAMSLQDVRRLDSLTSQEGPVVLVIRILVL